MKFDLDRIAHGIARRVVDGERHARGWMVRGATERRIAGGVRRAAERGGFGPARRRWLRRRVAHLINEWRDDPGPAV